MPWSTTRGMGLQFLWNSQQKALLCPSKQRATPPSPPQTVMAISASSLQQERPV